MSDLSDVIGSSEAADLLGVSTHYVIRLSESKQLISKEIKAGHLFLRSDVLKFKKERMEKAKSDKRIDLNRKKKKSKRS